MDNWWTVLHAIVSAVKADDEVSLKNISEACSKDTQLCGLAAKHGEQVQRAFATQATFLAAEALGTLREEDGYSNLDWWLSLEPKIADELWVLTHLSRVAPGDWPAEMEPDVDEADRSKQLLALVGEVLARYGQDSLGASLCRSVLSSHSRRKAGALKIEVALSRLRRTLAGHDSYVIFMFVAGQDALIDNRVLEPGTDLTFGYPFGRWQ